MLLFVIVTVFVVIFLAQIWFIYKAISNFRVGQSWSISNPNRKNLKCVFGFHRWGGCVCHQCGKIRSTGHHYPDNCEKCSICKQIRPNAHKWNGCKCTVCGAWKDQDHIWEYCKCKICGKVRDESHHWHYCKCSICEKQRDTGHQWEGCRCNVCFTTRDEGHIWSENCGKCSRCGKIRIDAHVWEGATCKICGTTKLDWADIQLTRLWGNYLEFKTKKETEGDAIHIFYKRHELNLNEHVALDILAQFQSAEWETLRLLGQKQPSLGVIIDYLAFIKSTSAIPLLERLLQNIELLSRREADLSYMWSPGIFSERILRALGNINGSESRRIVHEWFANKVNSEKWITPANTAEIIKLVDN